MKHPVLLYLLMLLMAYSCMSANDYLEKAKIEINNGNYRKAIKFLDKALSKKKFLSEAYTEKAFCYSKINKDDSAIIVYNRLLSFSPKNTLALYNIGLCKYRQEKFDKATQSFIDALKTKGYDPEDTSKLKMYIEYTPFGKEILGKDDRFDVPFTDLFYMLGLSYYSEGKRKKAFHYFKNCIEKEFNLPECHYMIGLCWLESNMKEKACESFAKSAFYDYSLAKEQLAKVCPGTIVPSFQLNLHK